MQSTKCSVRVNIITINLCCHFSLPCSSSSLTSVASKDGKLLISKEVIHLRLLDLKRNPHIQTWKSPQFCQNLYFLTVCPHFHFTWKVPEGKEGWKSKHFATPSYTHRHKSKTSLTPPSPGHIIPSLVCLQVSKGLFSCHQNVTQQWRVREQLWVLAFVVYIQVRSILIYFTQTCESLCHNCTFQPLWA